MHQKELQEIKAYWTDKYPHVNITIYPTGADGKFYGKMMTPNSCFDLNAETIGQLISQGESYLRKVVG